MVRQSWLDSSAEILVGRRFNDSLIGSPLKLEGRGVFLLARNSAASQKTCWSVGIGEGFNPSLTKRFRSSTAKFFHGILATSTKSASDLMLM